jgi:hypothetical protein
MVLEIVVAFPQNAASTPEECSPEAASHFECRHPDPERRRMGKDPYTFVFATRKAEKHICFDFALVFSVPA